MRAARLVEELLMMPGGAVKFTPAWQLGFPVRLSSRWVVESLSQPRSNASSNPVGTWLSLVEHSLGVRGVGSSNLPVPTNNFPSFSFRNLLGTAAVSTIATRRACVVFMHGASLDRILRPLLFASFAAHQAVERSKICTLPPFGEEGGRIHGCQLFCNSRGDELIYAHAIVLSAPLDFCFN